MQVDDVLGHIPFHFLRSSGSCHYVLSADDVLTADPKRCKLTTTADTKVFWYLGGDADGAHVQVALAHHDAPVCVRERVSECVRARAC